MIPLIVAEVVVKVISPVLLFCEIVPVIVPVTKPEPGLGLLCVMLIVRVVPGVMVAPLPVAEVVIVPKLAKVLGLASALALVTPLKTSVVVLPPLPKVKPLPPPLKLPDVE